MSLALLSKGGSPALNRPISDQSMQALEIDHNNDHVGQQSRPKTLLITFIAPTARIERKALGQRPGPGVRLTLGQRTVLLGCIILRSSAKATPQPSERVCGGPSPCSPRSKSSPHDPPDASSTASPPPTYQHPTPPTLHSIELSHTNIHDPTQPASTQTGRAEPNPIDFPRSSAALVLSKPVELSIA